MADAADLKSAGGNPVRVRVPPAASFLRTVMIGSRWLVLIAAISGFVCIGIGAMGSHSLPKLLHDSGFQENEVQKKLAQCEIAVKYQMVHTLAILTIGLSPATESRRTWKTASVLFLAGICLFSGGLFSMVFFNAMGHWSIVPLGGATLMFAWLSLGIGAVFPLKSSPGTGEIES